MRDTFWKVVMVGDFKDCDSCGEPCGHVWFVNVEFDNITKLPVCINTKNTPEGVMLCPEENEFWTPRESSREAVKSKIKALVEASKGPLYKLKDFCKGGAYEEAIIKRNTTKNEVMARYGLSNLREPSAPEKILSPKKVKST